MDLIKIVATATRIVTRSSKLHLDLRIKGRDLRLWRHMWSSCVSVNELKLGNSITCGAPYTPMPGWPVVKSGRQSNSSHRPGRSQ